MNVSMLKPYNKQDVKLSGLPKMILKPNDCTRIRAWCEKHFDEHRSPPPPPGQTLYTKENSHTLIWESPELDALWPTHCQQSMKPGTHRVQIVLMPPATFMPPHIDGHGAYRRYFGIDSSVPVHRIWCSLTEPDLGHVLMFDHHVYYNMPMGHCVRLPQGVEHSGVNAGWNNRWIAVCDGQTL